MLSKPRPLRSPCLSSPLPRFSHGKPYSTKILQFSSGNLPRGFWATEFNRQSFFAFLLRTALPPPNPSASDDANLEQLYHVNKQIIQDTGGSGLLRHYKGNLFNALADSYPHFTWDRAKFDELQRKSRTGGPGVGRSPGPPGAHKALWKSKQYRRNYLDKLKEQLGGEYESMYASTFALFRKTGGSRILTIYKGSPAAAVMSEYPEHEWKAWKFPRSPRGWWTASASKIAQKDDRSIQLIRSYFNELAQQHGIQQPQEWALVSKKKVGVGPWKHFTYLGGLASILPKIYPGQQWDGVLQQDRRKAKFKTASWSGKKSQKSLHSAAAQLVPS